MLERVAAAVHASLRVSTTGTLTARCSLFTFLNEGVSSTRFRIHNPVNTRMNDRRKGSRRPNVKKFASENTELVIEAASEPSARPNSAPVCGTAP